MSAIRMTQVTALVLTAVARGRRYGFDIMEACGLASGTVYPALRRLDKAGLLRSGWEDAEAAYSEGRPRRRTYTLSGAGREALGEADTKLDEVRRRLAEMGPTAVGEA